MINLNIFFFAKKFFTDLLENLEIIIVIELKKLCLISNWYLLQFWVIRTDGVFFQQKDSFGDFDFLFDRIDIERQYEKEFRARLTLSPYHFGKIKIRSYLWLYSLPTRLCNTPASDMTTVTPFTNTHKNAYCSRKKKTRKQYLSESKRKNR